MAPIATEPQAIVLAPASWATPFEWLPALSSYIARADAQGDVVLYLDARDADVDPVVLRTMVEAACDHLSAASEFAPIALLEGTVELPHAAEPVVDEIELAQLLNFVVPQIAEDPLEIVAHARWVKALADSLQAKVDSSLLDAAALTGYHNPLVTVRIPTYGSPDLLVSRAIPSVLAGAYGNIEVLVCSDGPQPETRAAVQAIADARVRYIELTERPVYPSRSESFWQTAGTFAVNRLLDEARGEVIAPLDHDDAFTYTHISRLLDGLRHCSGDMVYGQAMTEYPDGDWRLLGSAPLAYGEIVHATVMYTSRLAHMRYDPHAWLLDEPGDWNLWRRMRDAGAAIGHLPEPVVVHFKERSSIGHQERSPQAEAGDMARDVLATSARKLLRVCPPRSLSSLAQAPGGAAPVLTG